MKQMRFNTFATLFIEGPLLLFSLDPF